MGERPEINLGEPNSFDKDEFELIAHPDFNKLEIKEWLDSKKLSLNSGWKKILFKGKLYFMSTKEDEFGLLWDPRLKQQMRFTGNGYILNPSIPESLLKDPLYKRETKCLNL